MRDATGRDATRFFIDDLCQSMLWATAWAE
jgi:hypothetical protein